MANSTTDVDQLTQGQSAKEATANAFFDAVSQAKTYGRRQSTTSGLTWGYYGGNVTKADGTLVQVANGTLTLTASATNYVVADKATGAVSVSTATTNWNDSTNYWRLYSVVTGTATVTSYTDSRQLALYSGAAALASVAWTLTNKSIALGSNTLTGTMAEFNAACTDGDFGFEETGTFTPGLSATGSTFAALTTASGIYRRVGKLWHLRIRIKLAAAGNTLTANAVSITGLPMTLAATTSQGAVVHWFSGLTTAVITFSALGAAGGTALTLYKMASAVTGLTALVASDFANSSDFAINLTLQEA